jgi:hypothetical protein
MMAIPLNTFAAAATRITKPVVDELLANAVADVDI